MPSKPGLSELIRDEWISRRYLLLAGACRLWSLEPKFPASVDIVMHFAIVRDWDGLNVSNVN